MSYEDAIATKMLDQRCVICNRKLLDVHSCSIGIGPVCRKKNLIPELGLDRKVANKAIYEASIAAAKNNREKVLVLADLVEEEGYEKVADLIRRRFRRKNTVYIIYRNDKILVSAPYRQNALNEWRTLGHFDEKTVSRVVPISKKRDLWNFLKRHYYGLTGVGPKGNFKIA